MALSLVVDHLKKVGNEVRVEKRTPYAAIKLDRVNGVDQGYFYLQSGLCYHGKDGKPLKSPEIPEGLWAKMKEMDRKVLSELGWLEKMQEHFEQPVKPKEKVIAKRKAGRPRRAMEEVAPATE